MTNERGDDEDDINGKSTSAGPGLTSWGLTSATAAGGGRWSPVVVLRRAVGDWVRPKTEEGEQSGEISRWGEGRKGTLWWQRGSEVTQVGVANVQPAGRIAGTEENERQSSETGEGKTMKESATAAGGGRRLRNGGRQPCSR
uniref:Uncharacterized protein n=1 Tax=Opuntia streptacantha TaxID=393608 RepID=A0A7C9D2N8_OPUST